MMPQPPQQPPQQQPPVNPAWQRQFDISTLMLENIMRQMQNAWQEKPNAAKNRTTNIPVQSNGQPADSGPTVQPPTEPTT